MNILQTKRTYKTFANAEIALGNALERIGRTLKSTRYVIAATEDGRFAPVVIASSRDLTDLIPLAHIGVTVVG